MVHYHGYELDHFEIGRDLIFDLWLVHLQFILVILLVFARQWPFIAQDLVVIELLPNALDVWKVLL